MSMQSLAPSAISVTPPKRTSLAHIPGEEGWPVIGRTFSVLADPKGEVERMAAKYGLVYRTRVLGETSISMLGPEANELVLFDQDKLFSSTHGWGAILDRLFPRGLMLLDFDEHRLHRRALSVAFKSGPMKSYLAALDAGIARCVARWRQQSGTILFYPARSCRDLLSWRSHRSGSRRGDARVRRHGRGGGRPDPAPLAGHANGAWRQGPRPYRRLFLAADSTPSREGG